jgi:Na+-translocating ferredoxin:NAD+ oxidoreductase RNF subunit RnfB
MCYQACPLQGAAIALEEGLPYVVTAHCTGCGDCVTACPTPNALTLQTSKPLANLSVMP